MKNWIDDPRTLYKILFKNSPTPMWVYNSKSLRVLDVNQSAVFHYGYSRQDFLKKTIPELHRESDRKLFVRYKFPSAAVSASGFWWLQSKSGGLIPVEIISYRIFVKNQVARLVLAIDINERIRKRSPSRSAYLKKLKQKKTWQH